MFVIFPRRNRIALFLSPQTSFRKFRIFNNTWHKKMKKDKAGPAIVSNKIFRIIGHEERAVWRRPICSTKRDNSEKICLRKFTQYLMDDKPGWRWGEKRIEIHTSSSQLKYMDKVGVKHLKMKIKIYFCLKLKRIAQE